MERHWLIEYRHKQDLTHEQIADLVKIKRPYYSMIESGKRTPSVSVAKKIADVLDFDWTIFFRENGNESLLSGELLSS